MQRTRHTLMSSSYNVGVVFEGYQQRLPWPRLKSIPRARALGSQRRHDSEGKAPCARSCRCGLPVGRACHQSGAGSRPAARRQRPRVGERHGPARRPYQGVRPAPGRRPARPRQLPSSARGRRRRDQDLAVVGGAGVVQPGPWRGPRGERWPRRCWIDLRHPEAPRACHCPGPRAADLARQASPHLGGSDRPSEGGECSSVAGEISPPPPLPVGGPVPQGPRGQGDDGERNVDRGSYGRHQRVSPAAEGKAGRPLCRFGPGGGRTARDQQGPRIRPGPAGELPGAIQLGRRWRVSLVKLRAAVHGPEDRGTQDAGQFPVARLNGVRVHAQRD